MGRLDGDLMVLGVAGKMGVSLAIRDPRIGLFDPVLALAIEELESAGDTI